MPKGTLVRVKRHKHTTHIKNNLNGTNKHSGLLTSERGMH